MLGRTFSAPFPLYISPRPFRPALVSPRNARPRCWGSVIQLIFGSLRVAPAHRPGLPPAAAPDARPHDDVPGLRAISQLPRAVDSERMLDANERGPAPPRDLAGPRELLHVALRGDLPRLPHVAIQVPRPPRGFLPFFSRDGHGLRWLLVRHGNYPWISGFARRYISRPGSPPRGAVAGSKR